MSVSIAACCYCCLLLLLLLLQQTNSHTAYAQQTLTSRFYVYSRAGLIAVNYPARNSGIGRHCNITEAKKLCPDLIAQHVATWREGDDKWAYRSDAAENIATDKVSLDPYRIESRKILTLIRDSLPANLQKVEKASVDEVFLDLSAHVHSIMLQRFPELSAPAPYDDPTENLPLPSIVALDWKADALVDLGEDQEALDPDWDDVVMLLGSEIVRDVRAAVRSKLGYTCSAGIARNKLLSKLGSGFKKPNCQTVIRNRAVDLFLRDFKFTKIRNLGGKLGDQVVEAFSTDNVKEMLEVPLDGLQKKLGEETAVWLHNTIRGIDYSEVNPRTQIKSMLSAKSFRPTIHKPEQGTKWLLIFVGDIYTRLVEEGVLENKRRPRTIHLSARHGGQTRSKQIPIPQGKPIDQAMLMTLANDLFAQILAEGPIWPCNNLSLSVGGFEEGVKNNMGIGAFLLKGDEAVSSRAAAAAHQESRSASPERPTKKTKTESGNIQRFFSKPPGGDRSGPPLRDSLPLHNISATSTRDGSPAPPANEPVTDKPFGCPRCGESFDGPESLQSHQDWHMAKDLQDEERHLSRPPAPVSSSRQAPNKQTAATAAAGHVSKKAGRGGSAAGKLEQGQRRLNFG